MLKAIMALKSNEVLLQPVSVTFRDYWTQKLTPGVILWGLPACWTITQFRTHCRDEL